MTLTMDTPEILDRFDAIVRQVGAKGKGFGMRDLAVAHALARELEAPEPDRGKVGDFAFALGLNPELLR